jgi:hypothetical protein
MQTEHPEILDRLDQIEAKLDGIAAQLEGVLDVKLVLSQVGEMVRNQGQALRDLNDLTSREARATRTMIRLAPTSPAPAVAEREN